MLERYSRRDQLKRHDRVFSLDLLRDHKKSFENNGLKDPTYELHTGLRNDFARWRLLAHECALSKINSLPP
jgi:hypothetical protein